MSSIDERVVILEFNNAQFEQGVQQSVGTLTRLKNALNLADSSKGLDHLQKSAKSFSLSNVTDNIQTVADRFSMLGIVGDQVLRRLTDSAFNLGTKLLTAIPNQIISGGKRRAQNIEQAQFQLKGLLGDAYDWEKIYEDLDYAVAGTAYGIDSAAKAAAQLAASAVDFGDNMKVSLRGISGVAAMTNSEYDEIAHIFTKIAGQGKVMTEELNQFAARGLNVAATLAEAFGVTEEELRKAVTKGEVDFASFAVAMDNAFGEHATRANETFSGALSNVKASLSRMGQQFATPTYDNLRRILVKLIPVLKDVEKFIKPISAAYKEFAETVAATGERILENIHATFAGVLGLEGGDFTQAISGFTSFFTKVKDEAEATFSKINGLDTESAKNEKFAGRLIQRKKAAEEEFALEKRNVEVYKKLQEAYNSALEEADNFISQGKDQILVERDLEGTLDSLRNQLIEYEKVTRDVWQISDKDAKTEDEQKKRIQENDDLRSSLLELFEIEKEGADAYKMFSDVVDKTAENVAETTKKALAAPIDPIETKKKVDMLKRDVAKTDQLKGISAAYEEYEKGLKSINERAEEYIKAGRDEILVNKEKEAAIAELGKQFQDFDAEQSVSLKLQTDADKKKSKAQELTKKIYAQSAKTVGELRDKMFGLLGIERDENGQLRDNAKQYQGVEELANEVISGKYGNGEERKKQLNDLGLSYAIIQNRVNELLGCEKRHEVTAEDEARMSKYFGETMEETGKKVKAAQTIFEQLIDVFAGVGAAMSIIQQFGTALMTHVIAPFIKWSVPKVVHAILVPLAALGRQLVLLNEFFTSTDFFENAFSKLSNTVVEFFQLAGESEGVQALIASFEKLRAAIGNLWQIISSKLKEIKDNFVAFEASLDLPYMDIFVGLVSEVAFVLSIFVNALADVINEIPHLGEDIINLKNQFLSFLDTIGLFGAFETLLKPLTTILTSIKQFSSALKNIFGKPPEGEKDTLTFFQKLDLALLSLKASFKPVTDFFAGLKEKAKGLLSIVGLLGPLQSVGNFFSSMFGGKEVKEGEEENITLGQKLATVFSNTGSRLKSFGSAMKNIFSRAPEGEESTISVFDRIKLALGEIGWLFEPLTSKLKAWFDSIKNGVKTALTPVTNFFADVKKKISEFLAAIGLLEPLKTIFKPVTSIFESIGKGFTSIFGGKEVTEGEEGAISFGQKLTETFSNTGNRLSTFGTRVKAIFTEIPRDGEKATSTFDKLSLTFGQISWLFEPLTTKLKAWFATIKESVKTALTPLTNFFGLAKQAFTEFLSSIGLLEPMKALFSPVTSLFESVGRGFTSIFKGKEIAEGEEETISFGQKLTETFANTGDRLSTFGTRVKAIFNEVPRDGEKATSSIDKLKLIFSQITWLFEPLTTKLKGWFATVKEGVKTAFAPVGNFFVTAKQAAMEFLESIGLLEPMKAIFKPVASVFEGIGKGFSSIFGGKEVEEGEEKTLTFGERLGKAFTKTGTRLKSFSSAMKSIFSETPEGEESSITALDKFKLAFKEIGWLFEPITTKIKEVFKPVTDFFMSIPERVKTAFGTLTETTKQKLSPVTNFFDGVKTKVVGFLDSIGATDKIKQFFGPVGTVVENTKTRLSAFASTIKQIFSQTGKDAPSLGEKFKLAFEALKELFKPITDFFTSIPERIKGFWTSLTTGDSVIGKIVQKAKDLFASLRNFTANGVNVKGFIASIGDGLKNIWNSIRNGKAIENFFKSFTDQNGGLRIFAGIFDSLRQHNPAALLTNIGNAIKTFFSNIFDKQKKGENLNPFEAITANIGTSAKSLYDKIREKVSGIANVISTTFNTIFTKERMKKLVDLTKVAFVGSLFLLSISGIVRGILLMRDISMALHAFTANMCVNVILKIAAAFGIFAASLVALTLVDGHKLAHVIGSLSVLALVIGGVLIAMQLLGKLGEKKEDNEKATVASSLLGQFVDGLVDAFSNAIKLAGIGLMIAGLAAAVYLIAKTVSIVATIPIDQAVGAAIAIGIMFVALVGAAAAVGKLKDKFDKDATQSLLFIGGAMLAVAGTLVILGSYSEAAKNGLVIFSGLVFSIGFALNIFKDVLPNLKETAESIGPSAVKLAAGLLILANAFILLGTFGKQGAIGAGIITAFITVFSLLIGFVGKIPGISDSLLDLSVILETLGPSMIKFAGAMLILSGAAILLGTFWKQALAGVGILLLVTVVLSLAVAGFTVFLGILGDTEGTFETVHKGFEIFTNGITDLGKGLLLVAASVAAFGIAFYIMGNLIWTSGLKMAVAFAAFVGIIVVLSKLSPIIAPAIPTLIGLGHALLMIAAAVGIVALVLGGWKFIASAFSEGLEGMGESIGGFIETLTGGAGAIEGFASVFGSAIESIFGDSGTPKTYTLAIDTIETRLDNMDYLSEEVKDKILTKAGFIKSQDGKGYEMACDDLKATINGLDLTDEQKKQLLRETFEGLVLDAKEEFTLSVINLKMSLNDAGIDLEADENKDLADALEGLSNERVGDAGIHLENLNAIVDDLTLVDPSKANIKKAVEAVIKSDVEYETQIKSLKVLLMESGMSVDGAGKVESKIRAATDDESYSIVLNELLYTIDENTNIDEDAKADIQTKLQETINAKRAYTAELGTLTATVEDIAIQFKQQGDEKSAGVVEDFKKKIDAELAALGQELAKSGGSEEEHLAIVNAHIGQIGLIIDDMENSGKLDETQLADLKSKLENVLGASEQYAHVKSILINALDVGWSPEARAKFISLYNSLYNADKFDRVTVEKIWFEAHDAGFSDDQIENMFTKAQETLDSGVTRQIRLNNYEVALGKTDLSPEKQAELNTELQQYLDSDGKLAEVHKDAVIDLAIKKGLTPEQAEALVTEFLNQSSDAQVANLNLLKIMVSDIEFSSKAEKHAFEKKADNLLGLSGYALEVAIGEFLLDLSKSSIGDADLSLVETICDEITGTYEKMYNDQYALYLAHKNRMRRDKMTGGAYVINPTDTDDFINSESKIGKSMSKFFEKSNYELGSEAQATADYAALIKENLESGKMTFEDIVNSFGELKYNGKEVSEEELYRRLFPYGEFNPLAFEEFIRPYVDLTLTGASKTFQDEISKIDRIDWSVFDFLFSEDENGYLDNGSTKILKKNLAQKLQDNADELEPFVRDWKREQIEKWNKENPDDQKVYRDSDPLGLQDYIEWASNPENYELITDSGDRGLFAALMKWLNPENGIEEAEKATEKAEEYMGKSVDSILEKYVKDTSSAKDEMVEAYNNLDEAQKEGLKSLSEMFDPALTKDMPSFYELINGLLISSDSGKSVEDILNDETGDVKEAFMSAIGSLIDGEDTDYDMLATIFEEFPSLQTLFEAWLKEQKNIEIPENYDLGLEDAYKNLHIQDEINKEVDEALQGASQDEEGLLGNLTSKFFSGEISKDQLHEAIEGSGFVSQLVDGMEGELKEGVDKKDVKSSIVEAIFGKITSGEKFGGIEGFGSLIGDSVKGFLVDGVSGAAGDAVEGFLGKITENLPFLQDSGGSLGSNFLTGLRNSLDSHSPSKETQRIADDAVNGFVNRLKGRGTLLKVRNAAKAFVQAALNAITARLNEFGIAGTIAAWRFINGLGSANSSATTAGNNLSLAAENGVNERKDNWSELGENFAKGFAEGIQKQEEEVRKASARLAQEAEHALAIKAEIKSPSRVAMGLGNYWGMGYVIGINEFAKKAGDAGADLADEAIDALGNPLKTIQEVLDGDIDMDPVIRPVLDLDEIQNGAKKIARLMPNPNINLGYVSASMSSKRDPNEEVVSAILGMSDSMSQSRGDTYNINGITYDDGSNITEAVKTLVRAARVERRR